MESEPIFIGGLAHSGKTILRLMLSSHPKIVLTRRTYMWPRFYNRYGQLDQPDNFERCLNAMLKHKYMTVLKPDPDRIRREFWQGEPTYAHLFALFQEHYAEQVGKPRWGDQLGFVERYADPIFAAYPKAKMIHMIRDPRARYQQSVNHTRPRKGKAGWDIARWLHSASLTRRNQQRYPEGYKVVRYETLMSRTEDTLQDICGFIGETFVPAMVTMEDAIRFGDKPKKDVDRAGISTLDSDDGSYKMISKSELAFTQTYAGHDMLAFDYPLEPVRFSLRERILFYIVDWPTNRLGMAAWYTLRSRQLIAS